MSAGLIITGYLAVGALLAAFMAWATSKGIEHRHEDAEVEQAVSGLERDVSRIPGGMPVALAMVTVLWPLLIAMSAARKRP